MTNIVLASNNKKKIAELETLFDFGSSNLIKVMSLKDIGYTDDIVEDGTSFEENALIKASAPSRQGYIGIADDSGLAVDYLNGEPGIYSARYSGEDADDKRNREKLLMALENVAENDRGAKFVCVAALVLPQDSQLIIPEEWQISDELSSKTGLDPSRAMVVRGECRGVILTEEHGDGGFGYDSLFYFPEYNGTFAEISAEQKNLVSHRGNAMREFTSKIKTILSINGVK